MRLPVTVRMYARSRDWRTIRRSRGSRRVHRGTCVAVRHCTPGMLVTARDIVHRLPDADDARVRLELAEISAGAPAMPGSCAPFYGSWPRACHSVWQQRCLCLLCRSLRDHLRHPRRHCQRVSEVARALRIALPLPTVWAAIHDPVLVAACVPGARLVSVVGECLSGEVRATLGPIETLFTGEGTMVFDEADRRAEISGGGRDARTGSRLSARAVLKTTRSGQQCDAGHLSIEYTCAGRWRNLRAARWCANSRHRSPTITARNLATRLRGETPEAPRRLSRRRPDAPCDMAPTPCGC